MRGCVEVKPRGGGKYRFWFMGLPMTFSKLKKHFGNKTSADRLKAVWMRRHRPFRITDPEFFAPAFANYVREIEVVNYGVFPTAVAISRRFNIPLNVVRRRIRTLGNRLHLTDLEFDQGRHERMHKVLRERRIKQRKEQVTKRQRQAMPSDEWLAFSDRPRSTQPGGFHTPY